MQDKTNGKIASSDEIITDEDEDNTFTIGNKMFKLNISEGNLEERKIEGKIDGKQKIKNKEVQLLSLYLQWVLIMF